MNKPSEIRVLALALIRDGERLFLSQGYDSVKQQTFYRALGGVLSLVKLAMQPCNENFKKKFEQN